MKKMVLLFGMLLILIQSGCSSMSEGEKISLQETYWVPIMVSGAEKISLKADVQPSLRITKDNKVNGTAGDNFFFGNAVVSDELLKFASIGVTRRAGPNGEYEQKFLNMINSTEYYKINGDKLELFNRSGDLLGVFKVGIEKK